MSQNGLLTDVRWEWTGTEVTADLLTGETVLPVLDPLSITAGEFVWVASSGPYEITGTDPDAATFTVTPGLSLDVDSGTEVARDIGGKPGQVWVAEVILPDAAKPIEVPLTIHDLSVMPEGTYDPPVAIILSDDLQRVENLPGSLPVISGAYIPEDSLPPAEPAPDTEPAASPLPETEAGPSAVIIRFNAALDADEYDLYLGYDPADPIDATTLLMSNVTSPVWVYFDKNGVPLPTTSDTYFALVARNGTEEAAPSAWVPGRPGQVQQGYQEQILGDVIASRLTGQTVEGATIKGGVLDIFGALYATNGFLDITANQMQALAATFKDNVMIQGLKNKLAGDLEIGTGVATPTTKVSVSAGPWTTKSYQVSIGPNIWGLTNNAADTKHHSVTNSESGTNCALYHIRKSDGFTTVQILNSMPKATFTPWGGCARIGNNLYVLGTDSARDGDHYVYRYDLSQDPSGATNLTKQGEFFVMGSQLKKPAIGAWQGELIVAWISSNLNLRWRTYTALTGVETRDVTSTFVWPSRRDVWAVGDGGGVGVMIWADGFTPGSYDITMNTAPDEDFPLPGGTFNGMYYDGQRMHAHNQTKVHSGSRHPGGSYDYRWTQVDNDGADVAESLASPILTSSAVPRWQFPIITTPPPDDDGTVNGANTVGVYAAPTGFSGGPRKQFAAPVPPAPASYPDGTLSVAFDILDTTSGSAVVVPTINGFLDAAHVASNQPGRVWSLPTDGGGKQLVEVKGDGLAPRIRNLRMVRPQVRRRRAATQTYAATTWENHSYDTLEKAEGITVTNNTTLTIVRPGEYEILVHTTWDATSVARRLIDSILINGTRIGRGELAAPAGNNAHSAAHSNIIRKTVSLVAGDTIQTAGWQSGGSNATTLNTLGDTGSEAQTYMEVTYKGETS